MDDEDKILKRPDFRKKGRVEIEVKMLSKKAAYYDVFLPMSNILLYNNGGSSTVNRRGMSLSCMKQLTVLLVLSLKFIKLNMTRTK